MGIDILAFKNAKFISEEMPKDYEENDYQHLFNQKELSQNVKQVGYYTGEEEKRYSCTYSTYNRLREKIASLIGLTTEEVWEAENPSLAFIEMINFSDCAGAFDSDSCAELLKDFEEFEPIAISENDDYGFQYFYRSMKEIFEIGANNGFVIFR